MPAQRDYYDILGIKREAGAEEIRSAYRKLARELHPDVNKQPDAAERFNVVQEAYDVLSDETKRKQYDMFGRGGASPFGGGGGGRGGPTYAWTNVGGAPSGGSDFDLGSMFEEILRGQSGGDPFTGGFGRGARARSKPARGKDIHQDFAVDFTTAALGGKRSIRVRRGGGTQTIEITIPKSVKEGAKLRIRGAGSPSPGGAPPGDLILTIHIASHPYYRREGDDLILTLPISIVEAALGAKIDVPTFSGKKAEVVVPPGTSSGTRLRLRAQGLRPADGPPGDLMVEIKVVAPPKLDERDKAILEDVSKRLPSVREGEPWSDPGERGP